MNLQTTKPRAQWIGYLGFKAWLLSHPGTSIQAISRQPHDAAATLLKEHVLPRMVEGGRK